MAESEALVYVFVYIDISSLHLLFSILMPLSNKTELVDEFENFLAEFGSFAVFIFASFICITLYF